MHNRYIMSTDIYNIIFISILHSYNQMHTFIALNSHQTLHKTDSQLIIAMIHYIANIFFINKKCDFTSSS